METLLSTRAAILLALRMGPGYGTELIRRLREKSQDLVQLGHGNVYPALQSLEREGFVRSWTIVPRGARGARSRVYYELTPAGVSAAEVQRRAVAGLVLPARPPARGADLAAMVDGLRSCGEVSAFVLGLQDEVRKAKA
jgi:DNA-binding PadR family transcriptional regulator